MEETVGQRNSILCVCGVPQKLTSGDYELGKLYLRRRWWPKKRDPRRLWRPGKLLLGDFGDPGSSSSGARGGAGNLTSLIVGSPETRPSVFVGEHISIQPKVILGSMNLDIRHCWGPGHSTLQDCGAQEGVR